MERWRRPPRRRARPWPRHRRPRHQRPAGVRRRLPRRRERRALGGAPRPVHCPRAAAAAWPPPWPAPASTSWWPTGPLPAGMERRMGRAGSPRPAGRTAASPGPGRRHRTRAGAGGVVLSSSGTTGTPKVVRLGQDKLLHTARCVAAHLELQAGGPRLQPAAALPHQRRGGRPAVDAGGRLEPGARRPVPPDAASGTSWRDRSHHVDQRGARHRLASRRRCGPARPCHRGIRFIRSASAPLPVAAADRFEASTGIPVIETYGMTEAASQITAHPLSVPRRPGSVGLPVGVELRIVRQTRAGRAARWRRRSSTSATSRSAGLR